MIFSTYEKRQTIEQKRNAKFNNDEIRTKSCRCPVHGWLKHNEEGEVFTLTKAGIYKIYFNANVSSASTGEVSLILLANNKEVKSSRATTNIVEENKYSNISGSALVKVMPCQFVEIVIHNDSCQYLETENLNIIIEKVA